MEDNSAPWMLDCQAMTGQEKLEFVRNQMQEIWRTGQEKHVHCPYCLTTVAVGQPACCGTLYRAVNAVIEAREMVDRFEFANKIRERSNLVQ